MSDQSSSLARKIARVVIMTVGLGAIGLVFGIIGLFIGGKVLGANAEGFGTLGLAIAGLIIGYPAGIIIGIILIKKSLHQRGSLALGVLGSIIGAVITLLLAEPLNLNANTGLVFGVFFLVVPLFALAGFSLRK